MLMVGWFSPLSREISSPKQKSSSEPIEVSLSVEFHESGSCELIGQFCRDLIGCKTQMALG